MASQRSSPRPSQPIWKPWPIAFWKATCRRPTRPRPCSSRRRCRSPGRAWRPFWSHPTSIRPIQANAPPAAAVTTPTPPVAALSNAQSGSPVLSGGPRGVATLDRPREASVLSGTPRKAPPPPSRPASSGPTLRSYRPYLIAAGVLAVLALIAGIVYVPTANATLMVSGTAVKQDVTLLGVPGSASASGNQFATQAIHAEQSQSLPGTPTGQKQIPAQPSTGSVTTPCAPGWSMTS